MSTPRTDAFDTRERFEKFIIAQTRQSLFGPLATNKLSQNTFNRRQLRSTQTNTVECPDANVSQRLQKRLTNRVGGDGLFPSPSSHTTHRTGP